MPISRNNDDDIDNDNNKNGGIDYSPLYGAISLLIFTGWLLWFYSSPSVPRWLLVIIYISWFLGFSGVLLLPLDVAHVQLEGFYPQWVMIAWNIVYWTTFILAWVILPLIYSYIDCGEFTWQRRLKTAIHDNVKYYLISGFALFIAMIYLVIQEGTFNIGGVLMAFGNTYGMLLIVIGLGYGLVELPKRLWFYSFPEREILRLHIRAVVVDTDLFDAIFKLQDIEEEIKEMQEKTVQSSDPIIQAHMIAIVNKMENFPERPQELTTAANIKARQQKNGIDTKKKHNKNKNKDNNNLDDSSNGNGGSTLARLARKLDRAQTNCHKMKLVWDALLVQAEETESRAEKAIPYPTVVVVGSRGILATIQAYMIFTFDIIDYHWRLKIYKYYYKFVAIICGILSLLFIWTEITLSFPVNLSPFGRMLTGFESDGASFAAIQMVLLIPFLYVSVCMYRSLFQFKLFGEFHLRGPKQSFERPLLVNTQYLIRLQFALGYNFLLMLHYHSSDKTAFGHIMTNMQVIPILGTGFNFYAPIILVILSAFTLFHGYARLLRLIGIEHEDFMLKDDPETLEQIRLGKGLIQRALARMYRNVSNSNSSSTQTTIKARGASDNRYSRTPRDIANRNLLGYIVTSQRSTSAHSLGSEEEEDSGDGFL